MKNRRFKTPSRTSPDNDSRGCLCPDNTYKRECCDGSLQAQGIGSLVGGTIRSNVIHNTIQVTYNGVSVLYTT